MSTAKHFPLLEITTPDTLVYCRNLALAPNNGTIFIASYPKSGTTWMQAIVYHLLNINSSDLTHISDYSPFYENYRTWEDGKIKDKYAANHAKIGYSVFNTHLLPDMLPIPSDAAPPVYFIYVTRRGKDVAASFYHHLSHQVEEDNRLAYAESFSSFVTDWCSGALPFGRWVDHIQEWHNAAAQRNIFYISYEDLQQDLLGSIRRIGRYLNLTHTEDEAFLKKVEQRVCFSTMKRNIHLYQPVSVQWKDSFQFIRKGVVGDGDAHFTPELEERFCNMIAEAYPEGAPQWLVDLV